MHTSDIIPYTSQRIILAQEREQSEGVIRRHAAVPGHRAIAVTSSPLRRISGFVKSLRNGLNWSSYTGPDAAISSWSNLFVYRQKSHETVSAQRPTEATVRALHMSRMLTI